MKRSEEIHREARKSAEFRECHKIATLCGLSNTLGTLIDAGAIWRQVGCLFGIEDLGAGICASVRIVGEAPAT
jgi:hypothetical protein